MSGNEIERDIITDEDFLEAIEVQEAVLLAQGEERKVLGRIRVRITRGATEKSNRFYFDQRLGLVRTKRTVKRKEPSQAGQRSHTEKETGS